MSSPRRRHRTAAGLPTAPVGALVGALALTLVGGCAPADPQGSSRLDAGRSWSSVAGDPDNTGRAHHGVSETPTLAWSRSLGAPLTGVASSGSTDALLQATVSEGGCNLYSLDPADGRKKWCLRLPTEGPRITATVDGRNAGFVPLSGAVAGLSDDGELRWNTPVAGTPTTLALLSNRHLLVVDHMGAARVLTTHAGLPASPVAPLAGDVATPSPTYGVPWCGVGARGCVATGPAAVDTDSSTAYLTVWTPGQDAPDLVALRYTPGETSDAEGRLDELWRSPLPAGRAATPPLLTTDRHAVVLHSDDGALVARSTADGHELWSTPLGYRPDLPAAELPDGTLVTGGRSTSVWRGPSDPHAERSGPAPVVAVTGEGRERWRRADLEQLADPVATPDGTVLVAVRDPAGSGDGIALAVLDGGDGHTRSETVLPAVRGPVSGLSVDAGGTVLVSTAVGTVYAYR